VLKPVVKQYVEYESTHREYKFTWHQIKRDKEYDVDLTTCPVGTANKKIVMTRLHRKKNHEECLVFDTPGEENDSYCAPDCAFHHESKSGPIGWILWYDVLYKTPTQAHTMYIRAIDEIIDFEDFVIIPGPFHANYCIRVGSVFQSYNHFDVKDINIVGRFTQSLTGVYDLPTTYEHEIRPFVEVKPIKEYFPVTNAIPYNYDYLNYCISEGEMPVAHYYAHGNLRFDPYLIHPEPNWRVEAETVKEHKYETDSRKTGFVPEGSPVPKSKVSHEQLTMHVTRWYHYILGIQDNITDSIEGKDENEYCARIKKYSDDALNYCLRIGGEEFKGASLEKAFAIYRMRRSIPPPSGEIEPLRLMEHTRVPTKPTESTENEIYEQTSAYLIERRIFTGPFVPSEVTSTKSSLESPQKEGGVNRAMKRMMDYLRITSDFKTNPLFRFENFKKLLPELFDIIRMTKPKVFLSDIKESGGKHRIPGVHLAPISIVARWIGQFMFRVINQSFPAAFRGGLPTLKGGGVVVSGDAEFGSDNGTFETGRGITKLLLHRYDITTIDDIVDIIIGPHQLFSDKELREVIVRAFYYKDDLVNENTNGTPYLRVVPRIHNDYFEFLTRDLSCIYIETKRGISMGLGLTAPIVWLANALPLFANRHKFINFNFGNVSDDHLLVMKDVKDLDEITENIEKTGFKMHTGSKRKISPFAGVLRERLYYHADGEDNLKNLPDLALRPFIMPKSGSFPKNAYLTLPGLLKEVSNVDVRDKIAWKLLWQFKPKYDKLYKMSIDVTRGPNRLFDMIHRELVYKPLNHNLLDTRPELLSVPSNTDVDMVLAAKQVFEFESVGCIWRHMQDGRMLHYTETRSTHEEATLQYVALHNTNLESADASVPIGSMLMPKLTPVIGVEPSRATQEIPLTMPMIRKRIETQRVKDKPKYLPGDRFWNIRCKSLLIEPLFPLKTLSDINHAKSIALVDLANIHGPDSWKKEDMWLVEVAKRAYSMHDCVIFYDEMPGEDTYYHDPFVLRSRGTKVRADKKIIEHCHKLQFSHKPNNWECHVYTMDKAVRKECNIDKPILHPFMNDDFSKTYKLRRPPELVTRYLEFIRGLSDNKFRGILNSLSEYLEIEIEPNKSGIASAMEAIVEACIEIDGSEEEGLNILRDLGIPNIGGIKQIPPTQVDTLNPYNEGTAEWVQFEDTRNIMIRDLAYECFIAYNERGDMTYLSWMNHPVIGTRFSIFINEYNGKYGLEMQKYAERITNRPRPIKPEDRRIKFQIGQAGGEDLEVVPFPQRPYFYPYPYQVAPPDYIWAKGRIFFRQDSMIKGEKIIGWDKERNCEVDLYKPMDKSRYEPPEIIFRGDLGRCVKLYASGNDHFRKKLPQDEVMTVHGKEEELEWDEEIIPPKLPKVEDVKPAAEYTEVVNKNREKQMKAHKRKLIREMVQRAADQRMARKGGADILKVHKDTEFGYHVIISPHGKVYTYFKKVPAKGKFIPGRPFPQYILVDGRVHQWDNRNVVIAGNWSPHREARSLYYRLQSDGKTYQPEVGI